MKRAAEALVRCHQTETTKAMVQDIMAVTGERQWQLLWRLVLAEWLRLLHPGMETSTEDGPSSGV